MKRQSEKLNARIGIHKHKSSYDASHVVGDYLNGLQDMPHGFSSDFISRIEEIEKEIKKAGKDAKHMTHVMLLERVEAIFKMIDDAGNSELERNAVQFRSAYEQLLTAPTELREEADIIQKDKEVMKSELSRQHHRMAVYYRNRPDPDAPDALYEEAVRNRSGRVGTNQEVEQHED